MVNGYLEGVIITTYGEMITYYRAPTRRFTCFTRYMETLPYIQTTESLHLNTFYYIQTIRRWHINAFV